LTFPCRMHTPSIRTQDSSQSGDFLTAIGRRLQIMQKGARIRRFELKICWRRRMNSVFCDGMATTVTAAHQFIWRHLYASMQTAVWQTPTTRQQVSYLIKRVIYTRCDKRKTLSKYCYQCNGKSLTEKATEIEERSQWKSTRENAVFCRLDFDSTTFYENRLWNRRPD